MGVPRVPPLCRETQSLGQQMLNLPVGINGLRQSDLGYFDKNQQSLSMRAINATEFRSISNEKKHYKCNHIKSK